MGALVETTLVADYFPGIERGTTPRRWFCCVTVETAAAEILGFFAGGIVRELNRDGGNGSGGEEGGMVVGLEGGKAKLGGDDEGGVLEFDCLVVSTIGNGRVGVHGVLVIVLWLWEVMADVWVGGATGHGVGMEVLLLVVVPFGVVGSIVDVYILVVVVV